MANSNRLYRNFVILQEDERGYANSDEKTLSGYSKVEAKGDRCKISFYAQNFRKDDDYCVVLICCKKDMKQLVNLGQLKVNDTGKAEITKEYNDNNSKINFLEDYLIPSRRGNKDIWLDFSNLIRQNMLRNNEQEKNKVLIKNQRELTSLFLLYVIM